MEKMKARTLSQCEREMKKLMSLFPMCVSEGRDREGTLKKTINMELLKEIVGIGGGETDEKYEFSWVGKTDAVREVNKSTTKTLRPDVADSLEWDTTENIYIQGDNLTALKLLQEGYLSKIKVIYIDPPYNTGHDFIYSDHFAMDSHVYDAETGYFDEDGNINYRKENSALSGRYHSKWCSMIYARLLLARNLLREDGAIFISIDDKEHDNLRKIGNEIFGDVNYVASIPWRKRTAKSDVPFGVSQDYEYIVCYAKSPFFKASIEGSGRRYYVSEDYPGKPWRIHDLTKQTTASERPNSYFTIVNPKTGDEYPANPNATWRITRETFDSYYDEGRIVFPGDYSFLRISRPVLRYWKEDDEKKAGGQFGRRAVSTHLPAGVGMSQDGTKEIKKLFGTKVFPFPKPTSLLKYLLKSTTDDGDIILDFFSGSATTAEAVMRLNAEDEKHRKYILVQIEEKTQEKSEAYQAGYKTITELGLARIKLASEQIEGGIDKGVRVFKVDESHMKEVCFSPAETDQTLLPTLESNIKEDRSDLDLLFGCLVEWGLPLSKPYTSETIEGYTVHTYNEGDLIACFSENLSENILKIIAGRHPRRVVFRDSSFRTSSAKINAGEIFKLMSPGTSVRVL